jgi:tRNA(fMet)-specific endonuclease VapC
MLYLLDSNICIAFLKNNSLVVEKIRAVSIENLLLCSPVKAELWYGACKSERIATNQIVLKEFFAQFASVPFNDDVIEQYGEIRAFLAKSGQLIGANDLLIAAIATTHRLILVTNNTREFARVPHLTVEDWLNKS